MKIKKDISTEWILDYGLFALRINNRYTHDRRSGGIRYYYRTGCSSYTHSDRALSSIKSPMPSKMTWTLGDGLYAQYNFSKQYFLYIVLERLMVRFMPSSTKKWILILPGQPFLFEVQTFHQRTIFMYSSMYASHSQAGAYGYTTAALKITTIIRTSDSYNVQCIHGAGLEHVASARSANLQLFSRPQGRLILLVRLNVSLRLWAALFGSYLSSVPRVFQ